MTNSFAVVWDTGFISSHTEEEISRMYDLADCDMMDGVTGIYAVDEDGKLTEVRVGPSVPVQSTEEYPFYYAHSPIYAGTRLVGYVSHTDH